MRDQQDVRLRDDVILPQDGECGEAFEAERQTRRQQVLSSSLLSLQVQVLPTRWSTTLSSNAKLPHAINFGDLCTANLDT